MSHAPRNPHPNTERNDMQRNHQPAAPAVPARVTQPTVSLLNGFKYTPSHSTDIRQTFALARQAQEAIQ